MTLTARLLRCQRLPDPLGIGTAFPVFGWAPTGRASRQVAYRVRVASRPDGRADLWDSGRVGSAEVNGVRYAGVPLRSRQRAWWSVQLWDDRAAAGPPSAPAWFEVGLLQADDWQACWVGADAGVSAPLLRTTFVVPPDARQVRAYVSGLGHYELRLNGVRVGDRVLDPASTTYAEDPTLLGPDGEPVRLRSARTLYATYDVTGLVRAGRNAVGLVLGHGWFSAESDVRPAPYGRTPYGDRPRGIVQIEVQTADGARATVAATGDAWRAAPGPIVYNDYFAGERYDARREEPGWDRPDFDDRRWTAATVLETPVGGLHAQMLEPARVVETLPVRRVERSGEGVLVDLGQHVTGWTRIAVTGPAGATVTLRHAGRLDDTGRISSSNNMMARSPAEQTDTYVLRGEGEETWEPRFTLHGFRYVELAASDPAVTIGAVTGRVVHNDVARTGRFACDHPLLNRLHENLRWTLRASLQGFPQDAADRAERLAWLGDPGWTLPEYLYLFDCQAFWAKWLDDIRDCQLPDGAVPFVCPPHWRGPLPGALPLMDAMPYARWPDFSTLSYVFLAWQLYRYTGDRSLVAEHYPALRAALAWTAARCVDGILIDGFGEHMEPRPDGSSAVFAKDTPVPLVATAWLHAAAVAMAELAGTVDDAAGAAGHRRLAARVRAAFEAEFLTDAGIGSASQSALALSLWHGLVGDDRRAAVVDRLVGLVRADGLATGTMGTAALQHVLAGIGAADVMFDIATRTTFPGWGHQIARGATTIWETWAGEPDRSLNMKLLASVGVFLYRDVAGLSPGAPGWREIVVRPRLTHRLGTASAEVHTPRGPASVEWRRDAGGLVLDIGVPATSTARVWVPVGPAATAVSDGATDVWRADGEPVPDSAVRLTVGGGRHRFTVRER